MKKIENIIAENLLQIKAIKLEPTSPFLWASGWKSPIYCDNRLVLSFPETRQLVTRSFCELLQEYYSEATMIAGVATGAIAHGVLVADKIDLPFSYVRSAAKSHGLEGRVEGRVTGDDKVVVIEDLVSTGKSSLSAVNALRQTGCNILGMLAIFTYGFDIASENFRRENCKLDTLTDYHTLIEVARVRGLVGPEHLETLNRWRQDPANWNN